MFLHIGDGLLVKKSDIIAILDARQLMADENPQLFFDVLPKKSSNHSIKSLVLLDQETMTEGRKVRRKRQQRKKDPSGTLVMVSTIAAATLQKRFHNHLAEMMETESRE